MKAKFFLFLFLVLYAPSAFSQAENNNWYYGSQAGLNFNNNTNIVSVLLNNLNLATYYGSSSISNKVTGQLLFTSDGLHIWDRNFNLMPATTNQTHTFQLGQAVLAVPNIQNQNEYFVFSPIYFNGLMYATVNMSANNGFGEVVNQTWNSLHDETGSAFTIRADAITVAVNDLGNAYWVLYPYNNKLYAYKIDSLGLNTNPIVSNLTFTNNQSDSILFLQCIKVSPNNKKVAIAVSSNSQFSPNNSQMRVYDFDNATGQISSISNEIAVNEINVRNVEFSPNSDILFYNSIVFAPWPAPTFYSTYCHDLINNISRVMVPSNTFGYQYFQKTPNNEIYTSRSNSPRFESRILNPNNYIAASVDIDFLDLNPDSPNPQRNCNSYLPQPIPSLSCALYEKLSGTNITNNFSYQVSDHITTLNDGFNGDYVVGSSGSQTINLYAGNYIELKSGTLLKSGSNVLARIQPCGSGGSKIANTSSSINQSNIQNGSNDLIIAPNPANSVVLVKTTQNTFNKVTVMALDGKVIKVENTAEVNEYTIDISNMAKGIYLLSIDTKEGGVITKKLVKN